MMSRPCAVAGMFYPKDPARLGHLLGGFFNGTGPAKNARGIVCPHAGYVYSGQIAAHAFSTISPDFSGTFVVIGPSHNGYLTCASAIAWDTPLGPVETDEEFVTGTGYPGRRDGPDNRALDRRCSCRSSGTGSPERRSPPL